MRRFQPSAFLSKSPSNWYMLCEFLGVAIRNTSLSLLILLFIAAFAAAAISTANAFWHQPIVQRFMAALEEDLALVGASAVNRNAQPPLPLKDRSKLQRDENRERRKLATELGLRKPYPGNAQEVP